MRGLLQEVKARGEPKQDDQSIAGLLLKLKDPKTGQRLPDDRLAAEFAVVYQGGTETTSLTTAWAVYAPDRFYLVCLLVWCPRGWASLLQACMCLMDWCWRAFQRVQHANPLPHAQTSSCISHDLSKVGQRHGIGCRSMISQHPEVEAKVLAELDGLGLLVTPERPNPRPLEYDDLTKLTYTNNCIRVSDFVLCATVRFIPPCLLGSTEIDANLLFPL